MELVIPTMWKRPDFILRTLKYYLSLKEIKKVIIIDNDYANRPKDKIFNSKKIKILNYYKNIYVNPAWNKGMEHVSDDLVCICNDDICIDKLIIKLVQEFESLESNKIDLIGVGSRDFESFAIFPFKMDITKNLGKQALNFGIAMFIRKKHYKAIPDDLKVWFGDDYLVRNCKNVFAVSSNKFRGEMSATISSLRKEGSEIDLVIKNDTHNWENEYKGKSYF